jgi:Abortive infection C-terminus
MSKDWYPGIETFCEHWKHAPMLQQTFEALKRAFEEENDACIDASRAIVECACRVILSNLDDPLNPITPIEKDPSFSSLVSATIRVLQLSDIRDEAFKKLVSQHNKLTVALGDLRNKAGSTSHGKDGFIEKLSSHHRRSSLLAADAIISFIHYAYLEKKLDVALSKEPYERFNLGNEVIDAYATIRIQTDDDGLQRLMIVKPGKEPREEFEFSIPISRLLFDYDREIYKDVLNACLDSKSNDTQEAA